MERVALLGAGQSVFAAGRSADTYADLVFEAVEAALRDSALSIADIDNIVTCSNDFNDGRTISSMAVNDAAGAAFGGGKNISTVEGDGAFAAFYGLSRILSGAYRNTLVVAHAKSSEGDPRLISNAYFDPVLERPLGLDSVTAAALQARVFLREAGLRESDCAKVAVKNRASGAKNPKAERREAITLEQALAAPLLASPLRRHDAAPASDGAAALILGSESFAKRQARKPVWVEGVGLCAEAPFGERDLSKAPALASAAKAAYQMAGVSEPGRELDALELSEEFSYQELLWLRELDCELPERTNRSGGCLSARAPCAAGLVRLIEAALQIRGEAADPIGHVRRALAHGQNGLCGQSHAVWVLARG